MRFVPAVSGVVPAFGIAPRPGDANVFQAARDSTPKTATKGDPFREVAPSASHDGTAQLGPRRLQPAQERIVEELQQIDRRVRAHEAAHQAVAGSLGGAASFTYRSGPDGKSYVVGGEVPIDVSPGRTPEETVARAEQVRAAALAPADPSSQDLAVAAQASEMEAAGREQMVERQAAGAQATAEKRTGGAAVEKRRGGEAAPVLGPRRPAGARGEQLASSTVAESEGLRPASSSSARSFAGLDLGGQAAATIAALQSERASAGATSAQIQRLARLAAAAYRL